MEKLEDLLLSEVDNLDLELDKDQYDVIEEADDLIEETYMYMGLKERYTTKNMTTSNFVIKNGKAAEEKISNSK